MSERLSFLWNVGELPFIWKALRKGDATFGIPPRLPFSLSLDHVTGTIVQKPHDVVSHALDLVYSRGSVISGVMDEDEISSAYADDFIAFMQTSLDRKRFEGVKILEIGCGTGYLLYRLKLLGAEVLGIEPGIHGEERSRKYSIPIITDFFPSEKIQGKFDIIVMSSVLEHIQNPRPLLNQVRDHLNQAGKLLISVEDEEAYLQNGDVSILFHEHFSYFTERSLCNNLLLAGFDKVNIVKPSFSALLYAAAEETGFYEQRPPLDREESVRQAREYKKKSECHNKAIGEFIVDAFRNKKTIGIYVPGRIVNLLAMEKTPCEHIRFFDDNPSLHGTYYPAFDIPVESRNELTMNPVDIVLIMSHSFGGKIAGNLQPCLPPKSEIITWGELFA